LVIFFYDPPIARISALLTKAVGLFAYKLFVLNHTRIGPTV